MDEPIAVMRAQLCRGFRCRSAQGSLGGEAALDRSMVGQRVQRTATPKNRFCPAPTPTSSGKRNERNGKAVPDIKPPVLRPPAASVRRLAAVARAGQRNWPDTLNDVAPSPLEGMSGLRMEDTAQHHRKARRGFYVQVRGPRALFQLEAQGA